MEEKISWITAGTQVVDFTLPEFLLKSKDGFSEFPTNLQTVKAIGQEGETLIAQNLEPRDLSITLVICGETRQETLDRRRKLIRMFNSKKGLGKLRWIQEDKIYDIKSVCNGEIDFPNAGGKQHQIAVINLFAPDPRWFDPDRNSVILDNETTIVTNNGDVFTPLVIKIDGPVDNPVIQNKTTGEKLTINASIDSDQTIKVNSEFGEKEVILINSDGSKINYFNTIDPSSYLPRLAPGDNEIYSNCQAKLFFYDRYLGV
ncbi:phage tail domain-containing protein [Sporohalobacter salinus]|uniref:phage tail domain-containing protein n=1 Tax=Sporohalobacter salinus TaxID=1494606 RepID=UPI001960AEA4|nr:phage tail domain-containing protein [Sporohalobacter salinus]MBM7623714.1 phage-related protein [Sporohalobacter salinus]